MHLILGLYLAAALVVSCLWTVALNPKSWKMWLQVVVTGFLWPLLLGFLGYIAVMIFRERKKRGFQRK